MGMIKIGDLVKMQDRYYVTDTVGIVVDKHPRVPDAQKSQIGIHWFGGSGKVEWEPEGWLEVVSESG